jgi:hypothetical protein
MIALSYRTNIIDNNFITKEYPENGLFLIKIFIQNKEKIVAIDDYLPFSSDVYNYSKN